MLYFSSQKFRTPKVAGTRKGREGLITGPRTTFGVSVLGGVT